MPPRCASWRGRASPSASRRSTRRSPRAATLPRADGEVRAACARATLIDVDLHMHTDHSHGLRDPVDVLLATAREQGLGAIAVTDHNEISGRWRRAPRRTSTASR